MNSSVNSITSFVPGFSSVITLNDLRLKVNLGVGKDERFTKQQVKISFKLFFKTAPKGCTTDDINDTVCYFTISETIKEFCESKEFKLLEHLCFGLHEKIKDITPEGVKIWIMAEKHPPIINLAGSTAFEYTDLLE